MVSPNGYRGHDRPAPLARIPVASSAKITPPHISQRFTVLTSYRPIYTETGLVREIGKTGGIIPMFVARNSFTQAAREDFEIVRPEGLEPPTPGSEDRCSIQLSYGRIDVPRVGGATGLEPATPGTTTQCANRLRYAPRVSTPGRIRTSDRRLRRPLLCPLSYGRVIGQERKTGIEPAPLAWKARALPLSYFRAFDCRRGRIRTGDLSVPNAAR
jgi:hypothetical protein